MYKVTFNVSHGEIDIIQISEKKEESWALVKDKELLDKIEEKFIRTRGSYYGGKGYGEVIYTNQLTYVSGSFEKVTN
jgi:hypothetical protein